MEKRTPIDDEIVSFQKLDQTHLSIDKKLDELLELLENSDLDSQTVNQLKAKFNQAIDRENISSESIKVFEQLDDTQASRLELADNLETLLSQYQLDSTVSKKFVFMDKLQRLSQIIVGIILITIGFALIVMPAPPYFEMFVIFRFTLDDGFTLMDLIALLIAFTGVFLFISSLVKLNRHEYAQ